MTVLWDTQALKGQTKVVMPGETIPDVFWNGVAARGQQLMMREKKFGIWQGWSWTQAGTAVREMAMGLLALDFVPGECASILASTRLEWVLADLAVLSAGGVSNGIYPTDATSQVQYLCEDSATVILFVEDEEQLDKALTAREHLPRLRKIVVLDMEGLTRYSDPMVISLEALRALGRDHDSKHPGVFDQVRKSRQPQDLAILIYTSGTTGKPKGAMHNHAALVYMCHGYNQVIVQDEHDERMLFLPLCHVAERLGGQYFSIYTGTILNFVENPDTVPENVREIAPTTFTAVPRVWEKFYSSVTIAISESDKLQQLAYRWALGIGYKVSDKVTAGQAVPLWLKGCFYMGRWLALDNVRRMIGIHKAKVLVTGAAPISPDLVRWYLALGVPMIEAWGMTESCGASTVMPADKI